MKTTRPFVTIILRIIFRIQIAMKTWEKDSHDLFDYETERVKLSTFWVRKSVKLYRQGAEAVLRDEDDDSSNEFMEFIGKLNVKDDGTIYLVIFNNFRCCCF